MVLTRKPWLQLVVTYRADKLNKHKTKQVEYGHTWPNFTRLLIIQHHVFLAPLVNSIHFAYIWDGLSDIGSILKTEITLQSNISYKGHLYSNEIAHHSRAVGASPVGAATNTSSFSTYQLVSMDRAKPTTRRDGKLLSIGIWCALWYMFNGRFCS